MKKRNIKIFLILAALWINMFATPMAIWAQEATISPAETISPTPIAETPTTTPLPTEMISATPTPETVSFGGETLPCLTDICNQNIAQATVSAILTTESGNNAVNSSNGNSEINTGNATSANETQNQVNSIEVPSGSSVQNNNQANVETAIKVVADTGNNRNNQNNGNAYIKSGDAVAYANVVNIVNTNFEESNVSLYLLNEFSGEIQSIDLNTIWKLINYGGGNNQLNSDNFFVFNNNQARILNTIEVGANSGNNQASDNQGGGNIETGNATALLNIINLVNANLRGSKILIGVVNIDASKLGNIILPKPEYFTSVNNNGENTKENTNNIAIVNDKVEVKAGSGNNITENNNQGTINSGESLAIANNVSFINQSFRSGNQFVLQINNLGVWSGKIYNWDSPGSEIYASGTSNLFWANNFLTNPNNFNSGIQNQNYASVENQVKVWANTGSNEAANNLTGEINTGKAMAAANINNLININMTDSNWFYGIVNVVGEWKGDVIYAYPDVSVKINKLDDRISAGNVGSYRIDYANNGFDTALNTKLEISFPKEGIYKGNNLGITGNEENNKVILSLNKLEARSQGSIVVYMEAGTSYEAKSNQGPIKAALAAENEKEVIISSVIWTENTETDTSNNQSSVTETIVYGNNNEETTDQRQPEFVISAKNNVNDYVYPEDTVTFEVKAENKGEGEAKDSFLRQQIYDSHDRLLKSVDIQIGKISAHKSGTIRFGMPMDFITQNGSYYSTSQLIGYAMNGNMGESNTSRTDFIIRIKNNHVGSVYGRSQISQPEVKGLTDIHNQEEAPVGIYILLFCISSIWLIKQSEIWIKRIRK